VSVASVEAAVTSHSPFLLVAKRRLVVVGTMSVDPFAGMAWMHMQIAAGLLRLGHDVYYVEMSGNWPYDPLRQSHVGDSDYALPYLQSVVEEFGLGDRWAYRRGYSDKQWFGPCRTSAEDLLESADAVFNVTGTSRFPEQGLRAGRLVYFGTDPVHPELQYASGDPAMRKLIDEHDDVVTYGENIGTPNCSIPPLPRLRARTRQPVLLDMWACGAPARDVYTTVGNWAQTGRDVVYNGETYTWSKHHEWLKVIELPTRVQATLELATNLLDPSAIKHGPNEIVRAGGLHAGTATTLLEHRWQLSDGCSLSLNPWQYRDYIQRSRGEFTVARDLNVRLRSGWFSERSACYLAAGRPVITQNTGFGHVLPTGEGLFAFDTLEDCIGAFEAVEADYARHSRAARDIAEEYFRAERVLATLLTDLGL
jgi:hypothetical protein